ncbi:MAG TPA: carbon-nitrogen family hydrolase [Planctomycetota bacterium]|jgi:predicted amidohydrolase|nr:carbon-nitrogen family hydrolase [Planctomycetota bacterium]
MYVAGVQLDIVWENKKANHDQVRALLAAAKLPKGALVALPEMFATGFSMNVAEIAQSDQRETETFLAALAEEFGLHVCGGVVIRRPDGRGYNQSVTFAPDGMLLARYSKIHPFSYGGETEQYAAGTDVITYRLDPFLVAPFVCYDLRFPEIFRHAVKKGVQLYTVIANWPEPREAHWLALLKARAIENQAFVLGVNRCGRDPKNAYSGRSQILDPRGNVLADAGNAQGVFGAELDPAVLLDYRKAFPAIQDMKSGWL